jgi:3-oxoacyl-[acyl-carrier-protein] synthase II
MKRRAVISGMGIVSAYGPGIDVFWENISSGQSAAKLISGFDAKDYPVRFAAEITAERYNPREFIENKKSIKIMSKAVRFVLGAAEMAVRDAGVSRDSCDPQRFGVTLGAGGVGPVDAELWSEIRYGDAAQRVQESENDRENVGQIFKIVMGQINPLTPLKILPNMAAAHTAIIHGAQGSNYTIATACTSSAQAIGESLRQIQRGENDVVITGGTDSMINPMGVLGFNMLGVLSRNNDNYRKASRPFDRKRDGFMLGEGAAVLILEELEHCLKRNGKIYAEVVGYATTSDAFRITDEPPDGYGIAEVMRRAMRDAGTPPEKIDYINAHGTSTQMNDRTETRAIKQVFGDGAYEVPISSTKSMIGHWAAACGAAELIACTMAMKHGVLPPTINYEEPDLECDLDYVPNQAVPGEIKICLSNSFGFGGQNACLVISRFEEDEKR